MNTIPLTTKQRAIYDWMGTYYVTTGCPPTLRAIMKHFGHKSVHSAMIYVTELVKKGWARRGGDGERLAYVPIGFQVVPVKPMTFEGDDPATPKWVGVIDTSHCR